MAVPPQYGYKIGSGYNLPDGSLTNVEMLRPNGGQYLYPPQGYNAFNPGSVRIRMDGQVYNTGFPSVEWKFDTVFRDQYRLWQSNFTIGGNSYSGTVTMVTPNIQGTYTKYNSVMILPTLPAIERNFTAYRNMTIKFTRLQEVS